MNMISELREHGGVIHETHKEQGSLEAVEFLLKHKKKWEVLLETDKIDIIIQPKIDGLFVSIIYENGELVDCLTKGDRKAGYSLLPIINHINYLPKNIKSKGRVTILSELVASNSSLKKRKIDFNLHSNTNAKKIFGKLFFHAKGEGYDIPKLDVISFDILDNNNEIINFDDIENFFAYNKINSIPSLKYKLDLNDDKWVDYFNNPDKIIKNPVFKKIVSKYNIDGMVYKAYIFKKFTHVFRKNKKFKYLVAYKKHKYNEITKIRDITWIMNRNGHISPRVTIDPIKTDVSIVKYIRFHSYYGMKLKNIKIGDKIRIEGRGGCTFTIKEVLEPDKGDQLLEWNYPKKCYSCSKPTQMLGSKLFCKNPNCSVIVTEKIFIFLTSFLRKKDENFKIITRQDIYNLIERGYLRKYKDIFTLTKDNIKDILFRDRGKSEKILEIIKSAKNKNLFFFLKCLKIDGLGVSDYHLIEPFLKENKIGNIEEFTKVKSSELKRIGINNRNINNIYIYFLSEVNRNLIEGLDQYIKNEY